MLTQNYQGNQWYHACICRSKHFTGEDALFYHHENKSIEKKILVVKIFVGKIITIVKVFFGIKSYFWPKFCLVQFTTNILLTY